ncbi:MAG TPA: tetratricopeptide repeat protein [Polyangiaceae bacterium]|jgi:hypothetical protein|nr:tetratricopeptide repeat protein [Polyangiaceae bacterium]
MHGSDGSDDLERMNREQLTLKARVLGVERPELMTRVELRDEIVRRSEPDPVKQKRARGFLGVARDLVASVVEAGLNLPDAAAIIRGEGTREGDWKGPPPVATVTLAEIYAAQGHLDRALRMLDEVLAKEPDHDAARSLRDRLAVGTDVPKQPAPRRQRVSFADPPEADLSPPAPAPAPAPVAHSVPEAEPTPEPEPAPTPVPEVAPAPPAAASPYVLTLSIAGQRQVYWEVPAHTWDALRSRAPHGRAVLRVLSFRTRAGKVERRAHDFSPDAEVGSAVLPGLNADAVVRAALGWESDGRFLPFVIASDLVPGRFRAHPLVGPLAPEVEQRAVRHLSRHAAR